jgi:hypothetical protein
MLGYGSGFNTLSEPWRTSQIAGSSDVFERDSGLDVDVPLGCFFGSRPVGQIPIDLFFALDRSRSMQTIDRGATQSRWASIAAALDVFINSPRSSGLGAGITFFPRTAGGMPLLDGDYAFPVVPIGTLPGVAPSMLCDRRSPGIGHADDARARGCSRHSDASSFATRRRGPSSS